LTQARHFGRTPLTSGLHESEIIAELCNILNCAAIFRILGEMIAVAAQECAILSGKKPRMVWDCKKLARK
jgi:hypothetical protein